MDQRPADTIPERAARRAGGVGEVRVLLRRLWIHAFSVRIMRRVSAFAGTERPGKRDKLYTCASPDCGKIDRFESEALPRESGCGCSRSPTVPAPSRPA